MISIVILFVAGLVPLLWFKPGFFSAFGDDFPLYLNAHKVFSTGPYLWSTDYLGYATPAPAYLIYQYSGAILSTLGLSIGLIQVATNIFLFWVAGFSMFYLTRRIYPKYKFAAFMAGFFYLFNFFVLLDITNLGFIWTYAFLPLLLALFYNSIIFTYQQNKKAANRNIIYFALASVVAFSFASINPANVALLIIGLAVFALYFVFKCRNQLRSFLVSLSKIVGATIPINLWWVIPVLSSFALSSSQTLNSQISIEAWSWTQDRASFLNLLHLNGYWNWLPEYYPYWKIYSNYPVLAPLLTILLFVPFIVGGAALLFKSDKSRFNAYLMGVILCFLFLATGLHYESTIGQLNKDLFGLPLMSMFREPVTKFTLLLMPFLALLVGYGCENIADIKIKRVNFPHYKILALALLAAILLGSVFPLFENQTITVIENSPFSSSIQIPDYWTQATTWLNSQQGDWRVLLTPLDDYYQMPYNWSYGGTNYDYYGTDQLLERLIEKPIISTDVLNSYIVNPQTAVLLQELNYAIRYGRVSEFKALLDLLSVKYILQRNDINSSLANRNTLPDGTVSSISAIMSPRLMESFFEGQPYLRHVKTFGDLDIYEYIDARQSIYVEPLSSLQTLNNITIQNVPAQQKDWNFSQSQVISDWQIYSNNSSPVSVTEQGGNLTVILFGSSGDWEKIVSPSLSSQYGNIYNVSSTVYGENTAYVNITVLQYSQNQTLLEANPIGRGVNYGSETLTQINFEPLQDAKYFRIQLWVNMSEDVSQSTLNISDINVNGSYSALSANELDNLFNETLQNQIAKILDVNNFNPSEIIVNVNASNPFILATGQSLDNSWVANVNGQQIKPSQLYLGLQGFEINQTGQLKITLQYEPQSWFNWALAISISSLVILCSLLVFNGREAIRLFVLAIRKR